MEELLSRTNRRDFLKSGSVAAAFFALSASPFAAYAKDETVQLTILHTNDVHSRIEPFPMDGSRNQGMGGVARRAALIQKIRADKKMFFCWMPEIFFRELLILIYLGENLK